jgi:hypothetical protein
MFLLRPLVAVVVLIALYVTAFPALTGGVPRAEARTGACEELGETRFEVAYGSTCGGYWNIYASLPTSEHRKALSKQSDLANCGVLGHISLSDHFSSFTPDLKVVHSSPHPTLEQARAELARAQRCGIEGYTKQATYEPEADCGC